MLRTRLFFGFLPVLLILLAVGLYATMRWSIFPLAASPISKPSRLFKHA